MITKLRTRGCVQKKNIPTEDLIAKFKLTRMVRSSYYERWFHLGPSLAKAENAISSTKANPKRNLNHVRFDCVMYLTLRNCLRVI